MVEKIINFSAIEKKWQKKWADAGIFEAEVDKKKKKFFFTTPYPYISGSLHLGHGRAVVESDILCRYKRMQGFNVLYPISFHITGTPVLGIASAIKNGDKSKIRLYEEYVSAYVSDKEKVKKIVRGFENPQKIVDFFIPKMINEYKQLGLGVDWRRSFTSGDMEHQQLVSWQFQKYHDKGYLSKGKYPVLYSPEDESAMGEDDIQDADSNSVEKQEFTLLKFKFGDKFLVAATLRPETVFGQTNLWINPNVKYIEAKVGEEDWILSKEALEKLRYQRADVESKGYFKGELLGKKVIAPMIDRELMILPSKFVDADIGTGIVTSVPSDAPYDYIALRNLQEMSEMDKKKVYGFRLEQIEEIEDIEVIPIIETKKYGNRAAVEVVEKAGVVLEDDKRLDDLTQEVYKEGFHTGVLNDICGEYSGMKVIDAKEKIKARLIKEKKADIMYETSRKAFSRSGGKIIVAVLDNQWFIDFNSKGWKDKAFECLKNVEIVPENYRKQFEDTFAWLDKRPCARKRGLGTKLPFNKDWIIESLSDSTIYMTLYTIQALIREHELKRENLTEKFFDYIFLGKGDLKKVSKETGVKEKILKEIKESFEYWMPVDHRHTFVLHLANHLSFMIFAHAGVFPEKYWPKKITFHGLVISEGIKMSKSKGNLITLLFVKERYGADIFRFYMTQSSNIEGTFDWKEQEAQNARGTIGKLYLQIQEAIKEKKVGKVSSLYVSKFNRLKKKAGENIERMKLREYDNSVVFDMLALVRDAKLSLDKTELKAFYNMIVEDWVRMISPVCPHVAEELWSKLGKKNFVSLEKWPVWDEKKIDDKLEKQYESVERTIADIKHVKEITNIKSPEVYIYAIPPEVPVYQENSKRILSASGAVIVKVQAINDKNLFDPEGKSKKAKPGKPGLYIRPAKNTK